MDKRASTSLRIVFCSMRSGRTLPTLALAHQGEEGDRGAGMIGDHRQAFFDGRLIQPVLNRENPDHMLADFLRHAFEAPRYGGLMNAKGIGDLAQVESLFKTREHHQFFLRPEQVASGSQALSN